MSWCRLPIQERMRLIQEKTDQENKKILDEIKSWDSLPLEERQSLMKEKTDQHIRKILQEIDSLNSLPLEECQRSIQEKTDQQIKEILDKIESLVKGLDVFLAEWENLEPKNFQCEIDNLREKQMDFQWIFYKEELKYVERRRKFHVRRYEEINKKYNDEPPHKKCLRWKIPDEKLSWYRLPLEERMRLIQEKTDQQARKILDEIKSWDGLPLEERQSLMKEKTDQQIRKILEEIDSLNSLPLEEQEETIHEKTDEQIWEILENMKSLVNGLDVILKECENLEPKNFQWDIDDLRMKQINFERIFSEEEMKYFERRREFHVRTFDKSEERLMKKCIISKNK